jgi:hypothetical protein
MFNEVLSLMKIRSDNFTVLYEYSTEKGLEKAPGSIYSAAQAGRYFLPGKICRYRFQAASLRKHTYMISVVGYTCRPAPRRP